ncbi:uncharacterized protein ACRADG_009765 [Cochliomyia hominivorax]
MTDVNNSADRCVLCLDQKRSPVRIQCGHSFCYGCLDVYKSYRKYPWANKCPICRDILKEKKTTKKRKYSEITAETPNHSDSSLTRENSYNSNLSPSDSILILEEFMALATDYDYNNEDQRNLEYHNDLNNYEDLTNSIQDLTQDNNNGISFYEADLLEDQQTNENNSYEDSEYSEYDITDNIYDVDDNDYDNDNYDDNYDDDNYDTEDDVEINYGSPVHSYSNLRSYYQNNYYSEADYNDDVVEVIDLDMDPYDANRNWNYEIDWDLEIPSDVIIID